MPARGQGGGFFHLRREICSGGLNAQAARILKRKVYAVVGAMKVPAQHSLMLKSANPLGKGRPSPEGLEGVRRFTRNHGDALQTGRLKDLGSPWFAPVPVRPLAAVMGLLPNLSAAECLNMIRASRP